MSTAFFEDPANLLAPVWETDADLNLVETDAFTATRRKVEGQGNIADYVASTPKEMQLDGIVTAATLDPVTLQPQRLVDRKAKLQALAAKKQPVLVINPTNNLYLVITKVVSSKSQSDGHSMKFSISFIQVETTVAATAQVPASRLKPKVKKRAASGAKGGAAKGQAPTPRERSNALAALQAGGAGGRFGR